MKQVVCSRCGATCETNKYSLAAAKKGEEVICVQCRAHMEDMRVLKKYRQLNKDMGLKALVGKDKAAVAAAEKYRYFNIAVFDNVKKEYYNRLAAAPDDKKGKLKILVSVAEKTIEEMKCCRSAKTWNEWGDLEEEGPSLVGTINNEVKRNFLIRFRGASKSDADCLVRWHYQIHL